ncbi:MAG: hypothetical protein ACRD96_07245 [Bryobacteraceae bacterium]
MHTTKLAAALLVVLALVLSVASARAETVNCTAITTLPAVITEPGSYCFTGDLEASITSGLAINIRTDNVVLDLNGFRLSGLAAGLGTQAIGIIAVNLQNITIRNGTISGFLTGIWLIAAGGVSRGYVVENIRAAQNTHIGIDVGGLGTIVRNNQVVATGGTTFFGTNADVFGIVVFGDGPRVLNNDVTRIVKVGLGRASGIFTNAFGALLVNNRITEADTGIEFGFTGTGKYRDNLTFGVGRPYSAGGLDAGNNN